MPENEKTELSLNQLEKAVKLNQEILISADNAQKSIWTMCTKLKEMRDGKFYKELGYNNFEDYCESEVGFSRMQAHKYIAIVENVKLENVNSSLQIGVSKLYLLSTISESEQQEISEKVNLEETTVKELKAEIDKLKKDNNKLDAKLKAEAANAEEARSDLKNTQRKLDGKDREITRLEKENKELRSRPTEVAVIDRPIDDDNPKLKEAIRILERENMKRNEEMDRQYLQDRRDLEAKKQGEINALREEYEKKLADAAQPAEPMDENKLKFKVYLTAAFDTLSRLLDFAEQTGEQVYKDKIKQLLNGTLAKMED